MRAARFAICKGVASTSPCPMAMEMMVWPVPCALVELIVDAAIGDISALLTRQVDTEAVAETEGDHTLLPVLQSDGCRGVMAAVVEHRSAGPS